jgi:hypothetical protein
MQKYIDSLKKGVTEGFSREELENSKVYKDMKEEKDPAKRKEYGERNLREKMAELRAAHKEQAKLNSSAATFLPDWAPRSNKEERDKAAARSREAEKRYKIALAARKELVNGGKMNPTPDKDAG